MPPPTPQRAGDRAAIAELVQRAQAALARGSVRGAIDLLQQAIASDPSDVEPAFHLGNLFAVQGQTRAAIAAYERALQTAPEHAALKVNLGITLGQTGDVAGAERHFNEVLRREGAHAGALGNLAQSLFQRSAFADALTHYDRLLVVVPAAGAEIWNNRGVCQQQLGDRAGAEQSFRRAQAFDPQSPAIAANLGLLLYDGGHLDAAKPALAHALLLNPQRALVAAQLLYVDLHFADWTDFERRRDELVATVATLERRPGETVPPYVLLAVCDDPALQLAAARRWAWPAAGEPPPAARRTQERLRLGFVSSAFHDHPVPRLLVDVLERLDRTRYALHAYALGRGPQDALRQRVERSVDAFVELGHLATADAVARIRGDDIDLLFDLTGHTGQARPDVFAARPAPVQINYLGYAGTLGATYWDYVLTDTYSTPPAEQAHFSEKFCTVGPCYLPSDGKRTLAEPMPSRADYGLPEGAFVFVTQAATYKILPPLFALWMRLLESIPGAVLWLRSGEAVATANLRAEASRHGIDPARLVFAPTEAAPRYLARYALADLFLDTYPFGSHTTVNDALFAGLPVLTLAGHSMAARASAAQLAAVGLPELVATSYDDYESTARDLAGSRERLQALRARLHGEGHNAPLFDMVAYTRSFEAAVEQIARAAGVRAHA
jgi:predicted O-linked N-acetylglucosamine transferase (SPINDLY family)